MNNILKNFWKSNWSHIQQDIYFKLNKKINRVALGYTVDNTNIINTGTEYNLDDLLDSLPILKKESYYE